MEKTSLTTKESYTKRTFDAAIEEATRLAPFGRTISRQAMEASPGYRVHAHLLGEVWDLTERLEQVETDTEEDCLDSVKDIADLQEKCEAMADALHIMQGLLMMLPAQRDRVAKVIERLKKPLPTEQDEPGFGSMLIIDDVQRLDGVRPVTMLADHSGFDPSSIKVTIGGKEIENDFAPAVIHIGKNNEQLKREARVAGTQDMRGRPGYPRPAINEHVPGFVARADMLNHPDTVYERVNTKDKYRFHNGSFDKKDANTLEFRSRSGRTGFDCQGGKTPHFVTSDEKFFRVDTAAPLSFTGHALMAKLRSEPGQVYQSEVYQIHWDARLGKLMWRTQHSAMPSRWQPFNGFPARQYKRTAEVVREAQLQKPAAQPSAVKKYQHEELLKAVKAEPGRIFEHKDSLGYTHEVFFLESANTLMHRVTTQTAFEPVMVVGYEYTRTDRMYMGMVLGHAVVTKPPVGVRYTDKPKEMTIGSYYPMAECDADMRRNPGRVYRAEDQNRQMVYLSWDGKRFYMKRTLYGGWVFATVTTSGQGMRCGDHVRGPIHSSIAGRSTPNVRR